MNRRDGPIMRCKSRFSNLLQSAADIICSTSIFECDGCFVGHTKECHNALDILYNLKLVKQSPNGFKRTYMFELRQLRNILDREIKMVARVSKVKNGWIFGDQFPTSSFRECSRVGANGSDTAWSEFDHPLDFASIVCQCNRIK